jgi:hypothetical protein
MPQFNFTANDVLQNLQQNAELDQVHSGQIDPQFYPRPIISTLVNWDQKTQIDYAHPAQNPPTRPGYNVPSIAVTSEAVNTVKVSALTRFVSPTIATPSGMIPNPTHATREYKPVPSMAQSLFVDSNVQVSFTLVITTPTPSSPVFAVFRDGVKISQEYHQSTGPNAGQTLVSGTYVDTNPSLKKHHVYDLRWKTAADNVPVTAAEKNRTFQASNLRAQ